MTERIELIDIATPDAVRAVFTTREGGASAGPHAGLNIGSTTGDDPACVRENRRRLCAATGVDSDRVTMGWQVHGATVRAVSAPTRPGRFLGALSGWPEGDGLATDRPGLALVVLGADCLPVLLWRTDGTAVAAVHAGWRGIVGGVLEAAVATLGDPAEVGAAIGPGAGPCCYEVDETLRTRFSDGFGVEAVQGTAVDLAFAASVALRRTGVPDAGIARSRCCTVCDADRFYSYRRDGEATGRQAGMIWIERP